VESSMRTGKWRCWWVGSGAEAGCGKNATTEREWLLLIWSLLLLFLRSIGLYGPYIFIFMYS
jgi:hypothetical protein